MDYKEYSRLRSIARKRIERAAKAGATDLIRIPTVKEVRASANPAEYMNAVKAFLNTPGSTLTESKKKSVSFPEIKFTPPPPATKKEPMSPEAKRARRNEQKRRSKAKRAVERAAKSEKEARKQLGYLKALETVGENFRKAGIDVGQWLGVLSPKKAKQFVSYIEYRFAQGDYSNKYTIDTFIRDFGELYSKGYSFDDIEKDFGVFLDKMKSVEKRYKRAKKYGISSDNINQMWRVFVKSKTGQG